MVTRFRLAIYLGDERCKLGPGKVRLLRAVGEEGSISGAARSMGMAYRHAWLLIDELNRCFDEPVVVASIGGREGGGASLTAWGEELVQRFERMEAATAASLEDELRALEARVRGQKVRRRGAGRSRAARRPG